MYQTADVNVSHFKSSLVLGSASVGRRRPIGIAFHRRIKRIHCYITYPNSIAKIIGSINDVFQFPMKTWSARSDIPTRATSACLNHLFDTLTVWGERREVSVSWEENVFSPPLSPSTFLTVWGIYLYTLLYSFHLEGSFVAPSSVSFETLTEIHAIYLA